MDMRERIAGIVNEVGNHIDWDDAYEASDAIIAAMPDMVRELVWDGDEVDCFVICELDGRSYELCVEDTLERTCDYLWSVTYYVGRSGTRIMCGDPATFEAAKNAANDHRRSIVMSAFGVVS